MTDVIVSAETFLKSAPPDLLAYKFQERRPQGDSVRVFAVGDIALSGRVKRTIREQGGGVLLSEIAPLLLSGDIVFGNLECCLVDETDKNSLFSGTSSDIAVLSDAGFTLLHVANNHVYDQGPRGFINTLQTLRDAAIVPLGALYDEDPSHRLTEINIGNRRFGWLGCGRTLSQQSEEWPRFWEFNEQSLLSAVQDARGKVDLLIVSIHLGLMYLDYPHPQHKEMAHGLVAAGADLVLMHHAHVLQGVQSLDDRIICFNLGNFLFDSQEGNVKANMMKREQNESAVFLFEFDTNGICLAAALPVWMDERCQVRWAPGEHGMRILTRLLRISRPLSGDVSSKFWQQRAERNTGLVGKVAVFHLRHGNWRVLVQMVRQLRLHHVRMILGWLLHMAKKPFGRSSDSVGR